jgi:hypothetical protein
MALASTPSNIPKILLLNGSHDRETGPDHDNFTATEFVRTIVRSCTMAVDVQSYPWNRYVTHVIYLEGNGAPKVDVAELRMAGIEAIRVYGRRNLAGEGKGMLYDTVSLLQALGAILGKNRKRPETRRNTYDGTSTPER